jgi:hypothetical protein
MVTPFERTRGAEESDFLSHRLVRRTALQRIHTVFDYAWKANVIASKRKGNEVEPMHRWFPLRGILLAIGMEESVGDRPGTSDEIWTLKIEMVGRRIARQRFIGLDCPRRRVSVLSGTPSAELCSFWQSVT